MAPRRESQGFSLLEVLIAFTITALALGVVFQIVGKGTTALGLGREYAHAIALAESQLAAASLDGGTTATAGRVADQFDWILHTGAPTFPAEAPSTLTLKEVAVEVRWMSRGQTRAVHFVTLQPVLPQ